MTSPERVGARPARRGWRRSSRGTVQRVRCSLCSFENEELARFCSSCGAPLIDDEDATSTIAGLADLLGVLELDDELGNVLAEMPDGMGMLVVSHGPNLGSRYVLDQHRATLGRGPDSDIFLDDATVSRKHAVISREHDLFAVSDEGSLNGTYVNGERIELTTPLEHLAELRIGAFVLVFLQPVRNSDPALS